VAKQDPLKDAPSELQQKILQAVSELPPEEVFLGALPEQLTEQLTQHQQLSERLGRNLSTVTRWLQRYRQDGLAGLLEVKVAPGQPPKLTPEALAGLKAQLDSPSGFSSYGEIVEWLKTTYKLELTYATVYNWVHYRLKAKLKVPRPVSAQQDPAAVERFKKTSVLRC